MKEINIAKVLTDKRKEKGVTQEQLAEYIGITKASVSKWETGQSYPDVTLLPILAAYFNITIDELLDYHPQMTKEDIAALYRRFSKDFTEKPFDEVLQSWQDINKKYFACFPLLLQMGILIVNHANLAPDQQQTIALIREAEALFVRVKEESDEPSVARQALYMQAYCNLYTGNAQTVIDLLEDTVDIAMPPESLLATAYGMLNNPEKAEEILQVGIYQNIAVLYNFFPAYLMLCAKKPDRFEETLKRISAISKIFDMEHLHPSLCVNIPLTAAGGYVLQSKTDRALDMLDEYTRVVTGDIYPLKLRGDVFFDRVEPWLKRMDLGGALPRDEKTIRKSMVDAVAQNPAFSTLSGEPRFRILIDRLKQTLTEENK
ncbi:MAG: helix-turn-helix domain-containing protein [Anaerofustis sp.]